MENKLTGNEPVHSTIKSIPHDTLIEVTSDYDGIPIRLHIAANILAAYNNRYAWASANECIMSLELADKLISAYNNTPNPNE